MKLPRNEELHKLRHHRKAGPHGGSKRPLLNPQAAIKEQLDHEENEMSILPSVDTPDAPLSERRDVLRTCPPDRRHRYEKRALRVSDGERNPSYKTAIRLKCLECCCWQPVEVSRCQMADCALWGLGGQRVKAVESEDTQ